MRESVCATHITMEHPNELIARYFPHRAGVPNHLWNLLNLELEIRQDLTWSLNNIENERQKSMNHPANMVLQDPYERLRHAQLLYRANAARLTRVKEDIQKECEKLDAPPRLSSSMTLRAARGPRMMQPP